MAEANAVVDVGQVRFGKDLPLALIAGPCQMESHGHAFDIAGALKEICARLGVGLVYKTSFDKANRTSLKGRRGMGLKEALPVLLAAGMKSRSSSCDAWIDWPAVTATPLSFSTPAEAAGSVVIFTASSALAGLSLESLKPKSAALKLRAISSSVVTVLFAPEGAPFTGVTLNEAVAVDVFGSELPLVVPLSWTV